MFLYRIYYDELIFVPFISQPLRPYSSPSHASRAVDAQYLPVDPLAVLRSQEAHHAGDVDGQTDTVQRRPTGSVLVDLLVVELVTIGDVLPADGMVHVCADAAGGDGIDRDFLIAEVCDNVPNSQRRYNESMRRKRRGRRRQRNKVWGKQAATYRWPCTAQTSQ